MFKAVLTKPIEFISFEGIKTHIKVGTVVAICDMPSVISTDVDGNLDECSDGYLATYGNDTFDIDRDEFKTVD